MTADEDQSDLHPLAFPQVSWREGDLADALEALYRWVEGQAMRASNWYLRERRAKAWASRGLRIAATVLATAGAALPFVAANSDDVDIAWGYVLLALAAGAVALDRFFGLSSAWMRYMTAQQAIQRRLQHLQFSWAASQLARGDRAPTRDEAQALLTQLAEAATDISEEVRMETAAWTDEFRSNIGELRALAHTTRADSAPQRSP
jgi:hypothetical protein